MCDLWYQLESNYDEKKIKKRGIMIHFKIENKEDLKSLYNTMNDYYQDYKYNEVIIQMKEGEEDE